MALPRFAAKLAVVSLLSSLTWVAAPLRAQTCAVSVSCAPTGTTSSTLVVGRFTALTVTPSGTFSLRNGSALSQAQYAAGFANSEPVAVTAWSNAAFTATFTTGAVTPTAKGIGAFSWARNGSVACPSASGYTTLTNAATPVFASGTTTATPNAGLTTYLCLRTALSWTGDLSGTSISVPLSFTIGSP